MKKLFTIFITYFRIGLITIGGGYAMLPLIQHDLVNKHGFMTDEEFLDNIAVSNSMPGPFATNCAIFVGYKVAGIWGSFAALIGAITPSIICILIIAMIFDNILEVSVVQSVLRALRPAVLGSMVYACINMAKTAKVGKYFNFVPAIISAVALIFFGVHPFIIIIGGALYGIFIQSRIMENDAKKSKKKEESHE